METKVLQSCVFDGVTKMSCKCRFSKQGESTIKEDLIWEQVTILAVKVIENWVFTMFLQPFRHPTSALCK